jgi:uncharacterized MAPEG superfamily protein
MPVELSLLGWSVVLLLVYITVQAAFAIPLRGLAWNAGPRDEGQPPLGKYPGRAARALRNFLETYAAFVALALSLVHADKIGGSGTLGAELWFGARIVYLPLYLLGVPWLRTLSYGVSLVGLVMMLVRLLQP